MKTIKFYGDSVVKTPFTVLLYVVITRNINFLVCCMVIRGSTGSFILLRVFQWCSVTP